MRILFMGTPEFAVPCLEALLQAGHEVCGVYTQPDKPKGRGYALAPPPVKELAQRFGLPVFQPKTLRTPEAAAEARALAPEVIVVVAYGKILPKEILEIPPRGCVNVHASLLPKYRGAGPIQWAVLNGETVTGVTTMYMAEGLDTGDMILRRETPIGPEETAGELHDRLSQLGAQLLTETLGQIAAGTAPRIPQEGASSYAPMLTKDLCPVDWTKSAQQVHNQVRGLSPWPVASTVYQGKRLRIHRAALADGISGSPGELRTADGRFVVCCGEGAVELCSVQYEGGKRMDGVDFLRGHPPCAARIDG